MISRRRFITGVVLAVTPLGATASAQEYKAQQAGKVHRIGFLGNSTAAFEANLVGPLREGLRERGYVEGQNILIEYRWAEGNYERFPTLIAELLARNVEVIVTAVHRPPSRSKRRQCRFLSSWWPSAILSLRASSRASRGPAATSPD